MGHNPSEQKIQREIAILKKCVHPHVVRLQEVIDDPASRKIYMGTCMGIHQVSCMMHMC